MKNLKCRILSMLLIFVILASSLVIPSFAAETSDLQYNYSKTYNSGKRHEICTTLNGTSASSYYTGSYTYDRLDDLSASDLQSSLHTLMTETHTKITTYANCRDMAIYTDCELEANDGVTDTTKQTVVLLYTSYTATRSQWDGWNREHVWPQSLGIKQDTPTGGGADLHHVRPADAGVNSSRGNKPYNNTNRSGVKYGTNPAVGVLGGYYDSTYFEPLDNVKGDVARICLYVWIRWGSAWGADSITELFPSTDVLLEWMELDPVDTWEMGRNEVVGAIQGNRNVFIDYPELAWLILGEEIPEDMVTPSGEAMKSVGDPNCSHSNTVIKNAVAATCTAVGNTGDLRCADCNMLITAGVEIPAKGHGETTLKDAKDPTCTATGYTGDTYCNDCGGKVTSGTIISAKGHNSTRVEGAKEPTCTEKGYTGDTYCTVCNVKTIAGTSISEKGHSWSSWVEDADAGTKSRTCGTCGEVETVEIETPECTHENTEIRNAKAATCSAQGYTGDTYCTDCGEKLSSGTVIATKKHGTTSIEGAKNPTCDENGYTGDAYCNDCGIKVTSGTTIPANGHGETTLKDAKDPTCNATGYTGDTYCNDCGKKVTSGTTIPATGEHTYGSAVVTKEPTVEENGEKTYTCEICGYKKTEVIEYVAPDDEPTDNPNTPGTEKDSYFGESCGTDEELVIAILSKNALYAFFIDWFTKG